MLDFKYWEDASDEFRDEGTLLPLWKFQFEKAKRLEITGLCWNPAYKDLFAASYGSCNYQLYIYTYKQISSVITYLSSLFISNKIIAILDSFYEQNVKTNGVVCVFSLKNPSYPEYVCYAPCGIMSLDINPKHPHMMVAGLADGNVAVYNLQTPGRKPAYLSSARNGKHKDIVWQVGSHS